MSIFVFINAAYASLNSLFLKIVVARPDTQYFICIGSDIDSSVVCILDFTVSYSSESRWLRYTYATSLSV